MSDIIGQGVPVFYDHINIQNAMENPSNIHCSNVGLQRYYARYLLQKCISQFKWTLPDSWDQNYFLYVLYCWGFISVLNTDKFGVIPQGCSLKGYNVMYQPTHAIIVNPLFRQNYELLIGEECALIKLQPDWCGVMDIVNFYADMLALCSENAGVNALNSKLAYIFRCSNKGQAETFKKMFDQISSGQPAVFVDKMLKNEDGDTSPLWQEFNQDLSKNYIMNQILDDMRMWLEKFDTEIGIPNANTQKKERLVTDEVNANNNEVECLIDLWESELRKGVDKANDLFGINIQFERRFKQQSQVPAMKEISDGTE